jgi:aminopeptidase N
MKKNYIFLLTTVSFLASCGLNKTKDVSPQVAAAENAKTELEVVEEESFSTEPTVYRATETVLTDLVHTKLQVKFDWEKSQLIGIATITAKPHFYPSDSLILDAKSMEIKSVKMAGASLKYTYANDFLKIQLDKEYKKNEKYTV